MTKLLATIDKYRGLALLLAGGIAATGFAPLNLWPVTLLCLALLMHLVARAESGKRAFLLGWLFGLGQFTIGNNWIATAFTYQAAMPAWLGWLAVILLALYLAVYPGLAALGGWWISHSSLSFESAIGAEVPARETTPALHALASHKSAELNLPFILAFAGCWIIAEWLRSWLFTGFAWNPLSASLVGPAAAPVTWLGSYGFSGMLVLLTGCGFQLASKQIKRALLILAPLGIFWGATSLYSAYEGLQIPNEMSRRPNLTVVQPNISQIDKYDPGYDAVNFSRLAQNSQPRDGQPRLLLWPEAAIPWRIEDGYPLRYYQFQPGETPQGARLALIRLMNPGDVLLTGIDRLEFDKNGQLIGARNSTTAMDSSGNILGNYDKAHLVPFGEYLALRWLLEPLGATRLVPGTIDFWPGPGPRTLNLPFEGKRVKVGIAICYEIAFPGQVSDRADRPDFIFNPSNDAWFGSWGPPQHLAQARLRAIEEGLPVVRSTPTGISAVIDADGRIIQSLPHNKAGRIDARLPTAKPPTLFARYGNILPLGFAALLILVALMSLAGHRLSR